MKPALALLVKPLLLTSVLTLGFVSLHFQWWGSFTELDLLNHLFERHWAVAWPVFAVTGIIYTALGGPRQVLAFACGCVIAPRRRVPTPSFLLCGHPIFLKMH